MTPVRTAPTVAFLVLVACSSRSAPMSPDKPTTTSPSSDASRTATMPMKKPVTVERAFPDATWEAAADLALARVEPSMPKDPEITRISIKPLTAPDSSTLPFLLVYEAFSATRSEFTESILVVNGKIVEREDGAAAAGAYLATLGFPAKHLDVGLVYETLIDYGVVKSWTGAPSAEGWRVLSGGMGGVNPVTLVYDQAGARLTTSSVIKMEAPPLFKRLVVHFDAHAAITLTSERQLTSETWEPIPVEP